MGSPCHGVQHAYDNSTPVPFCVPPQYHKGRQFVEYVLSINLLADGAVPPADRHKVKNRAGKWMFNGDAQKARRVLGFDMVMRQRREGMHYLQV